MTNSLRREDLNQVEVSFSGFESQMEYEITTLNIGVGNVDRLRVCKISSPTVKSELDQVNRNVSQGLDNFMNQESVSQNERRVYARSNRRFHDKTFSRRDYR